MRANGALTITITITIDTTSSVTTTSSTGTGATSGTTGNTGLSVVVDSSALLEQVIDAVVQSAFRSAGQRCSALCLLCVHAAIADGVIAMLKGAASELVVGDTADLATDVGPVIDVEANDNRHSVNTSSAASLPTALPAPAVMTAGTTTLSPSPARAEESALRAPPGEWPRPPRTCATLCSLACWCASGCGRCPNAFAATCSVTRAHSMRRCVFFARGAAESGIGLPRCGKG